MESIGSDRNRFSPRRDIASTYFDQRIPIPRVKEVSLLLKSNKNVIALHIFKLYLPVSICSYFLRVLHCSSIFKFKLTLVLCASGQLLLNSNSLICVALY